MRFAKARLKPLLNEPETPGSFGAPCIQNPLADPNEHPYPEAPKPSEDCLFLNVWTPHEYNEKSKERLPVMVWIHGGGLIEGASSSAWTHGARLSHEHGVVVVSFNYRLGALGFLVLDGVPGAASHLDIENNGGMNGIRDQTVALHWIRENIAKFGGDPNRVTIFGESAGGYSICTLLLSPLASGLYQRAIIQSGPCIGKWGPLNATYGRDVTSRIMRNVSAKNFKDLLSVPAESIQWPYREMYDPTVSPYFSGYFYGSTVIPANTTTEELFKRGNFSVESVIIGTTSKDGTAASTILVWCRLSVKKALMYTGDSSIKSLGPRMDL